DDGIGSPHPAMDTDDSSGVHITWYDYKYSPYAWTGDIFYRASRDSGNTWEPIDSLTVMHRAVASDILAEGNNLHLVWEDDRNGFDENFEIYYRMSTDLGRSWGPEERLTYANNWSRRPSLACDGQYLHLFWFDLRDDPTNRVGEIYYKRKTLVGINDTQPVKYLSPCLSLDCPTILRRNSSIRYDLGSNKDGEIELIDAMGRVIETFPLHHVSGEFVFPYNKEVQDGVYFIMLKAGLTYITKKVVVVR
ncbi:MAG: T9SS type A sorting domain-containing protein, partial [bacterium]